MCGNNSPLSELKGLKETPEMFLFLVKTEIARWIVKMDFLMLRYPDNLQVNE